MESRVRIVIIGDYDPKRPSLVATEAAVRHAAGALGMAVDLAWQPTPSLLHPEGLTELSQADGFWAAPSSPYASFEGMLTGIRLARERGRSFIAT